MNEIHGDPEVDGALKHKITEFSTLKSTETKTQNSTYNTIFATETHYTLIMEQLDCSEHAIQFNLALPVTEKEARK